MPGMPFHLEKGYALMALEDLFNNPALHELAKQSYERMCAGDAMKDVFRDAVKHTTLGAPLLDAYGGNADVGNAGGLGHFVASAWFDETNQGQQAYWQDYDGDVDGVVRNALLFALNKAWGRTGCEGELPSTRPPDWRPVEWFWACGLRWFEAFVSWEQSGGVQLLFVTPAHVKGQVIPDMAVAVANDFAHATTSAEAVGRDRDMVVVRQQDQVETLWLDLHLVATPAGEIALPSIGNRFAGSGDVGTWSVSDKGGGMRPHFPWQ